MRIAIKIYKRAEGKFYESEEIIFRGAKVKFPTEQIKYSV